MKGQLSLEYLLLATAALSMLALSALALSEIRKSADAGFGSMRFRMDASALSASISEVCSLGDGNGRELSLGGPVAVESVRAGERWAVRLSDGASSLVRESACEARGGENEGLIYVENEKGAVTVRGR